MCLRNSLSYGQAVSEAGPPRVEEFMLLFLYQGGFTLGADTPIMSLTLEGARFVVFVHTMQRLFSLYRTVLYSTGPGGGDSKRLYVHRKGKVPFRPSRNCHLSYP